MNPKIQTDYLIVGQGISGSLLAWKLRQLGKSVLVVDAGHTQAASRVAAGMINPVPGQRLSLAWELASCLPAARATYGELENVFQQPFFHERPILRMTRNDREESFLQGRLQDPRFIPYLSPAPKSLPGEITLPPQSTAFLTMGGGQLDIPLLISCLRQWLLEGGLLCEEALSHRDVIPDRRGVHWKGRCFAQVVFCEGWQAIRNPWFAHLPFDPVKGAILTIDPQGGPRPDWILNSGQWLLPTPNGLLKAGATYDREDLESTVCTAANTNAICTVVERYWKGPLREHIVAGGSGIRPCTRTNWPLLGRHPVHSRLVLFNGLGSKGSLFAPWLADQLIGHLENNAPLPRDVRLRTLETRGRP